MYSPTDDLSLVNLPNNDAEVRALLCPTLGTGPALWLLALLLALALLLLLVRWRLNDPAADVPARYAASREGVMA